MMRPASATKTNPRVQTVSSTARNKAIKSDTMKAEARRNYKPPPSAGKKEANR